MNDGFDPSIIVIYDYDDDKCGENIGKYSWEYCNGNYSILMLAPALYDDFDSCAKDMAEAVEIARRAPVYYEGEAFFKTRHKKGQFELFTWQGGWGFYWRDLHPYSEGQAGFRYLGILHRKVPGPGHPVHGDAPARP